MKRSLNTFDSDDETFAIDENKKAVVADESSLPPAKRQKVRSNKSSREEVVVEVEDDDIIAWFNSTLDINTNQDERKKEEFEFPVNGCFIRVTPRMIRIQLANGFSFELGEKATARINGLITKVNTSNNDANGKKQLTDEKVDKKVCEVANQFTRDLFFMTLINDMYRILQHAEPNQSFFGRNADIPVNFLKKYNLVHVKYDCKIYNKLCIKMQPIWDSEQFNLNLNDLSRFLTIFSPNLPRKTTDKNRKSLGKSFGSDNLADARLRLSEWYEIILDKINEEKQKDLKTMAENVLAMKGIMSPIYQYALTNDFFLLTKGNNQYQSYWDNSVNNNNNTANPTITISSEKEKKIVSKEEINKNVNYVHIENCQDYLCLGKFESNLISEIIHGNVECMNGLPYLCDIIGNYCALSDNTQSNKNSQLLFDCFKKQYHNYFQNLNNAKSKHTSKKMD